MATVLTTDFNYTYPGLLSTEVLYKPTVDTPAINSIARILQGIKFKQQLPLTTPLQKIVKAYEGCSRTFNGATELFNRTLEVDELDVNLEFCKDDFTGWLQSPKAFNIFAEQLNNGIDSFNLDGTIVNTIITNLIEDAVRRDLFRVLSFGDKNDANADYNQLDGIWTKLIEDSGSGSTYCVRRSATLGTGTLSADEALTALRSSYEQADPILKQMPNSMKHFLVTGSVYENLYASYESKSNGTERQFSLLLDGSNGLTYRGIPVIPVYAWDTALADTDNPLNGEVEHLILYTTPDNHFVGVEASSDLSRIEGWYERKDRKYYFEGNMKIGYQYGHCDLQVIAY